MSASYKKGDGFVLLYKDHNDLIKTITETQFDEQVDYDEQKAKEQVELEKYIKRGCIIRILIFPLEWLLTRILLGSKGTSLLTKMNKEYYNYTRGKSTYEHIRKYI